MEGWIAITAYYIMMGTFAIVMSVFVVVPVVNWLFGA